MVDVSYEREIQGVVKLDVTGKVLIPSRWLTAHRLMDNLQLKSAFETLLESDKVSHRIVGEMLLDLTSDEVPAWNRYGWVLLDLDTKRLTGLLETAQSKVDVYCKGARLGCACGSRYNVAMRQVFDDFKGGADELQYNKLMRTRLFRGYPIVLKSMHPRHENVEVGIEVVSGKKTDESASLYSQTGRTVWAQMAIEYAENKNRR